MFFKRTRVAPFEDTHFDPEFSDVAPLEPPFTSCEETQGLFISPALYIAGALCGLAWTAAAWALLWAWALQ